MRRHAATPASPERKTIIAPDDGSGTVPGASKVTVTGFVAVACRVPEYKTLLPAFVIDTFQGSGPVQQSVRPYSFRLASVAGPASVMSR